MGKRALAGESLAFQWFRASGQSGLVAFAGVLPGQVRVIELDGTGGWFAEKDAFVAAESTVDFDIAFQGWKTGRKGGEGFVLEKFTGTGTLVPRRRRQLHRPQPGQVRRQDPGRHRLRRRVPGHGEVRDRAGRRRSTRRPR